MRWDCISPSPLPCPVMLWGRRRRGWTFFFMVWRFCSERELFNLLPCVAEQYRGETEETVVSEERGWKDRIKFWLYVLIPPALRTSLYFAVQNTPYGYGTRQWRSVWMPRNAAGIGEVFKGLFSFWGVRIYFTLLSCRVPCFAGIRNTIGKKR